VLPSGSLPGGLKLLDQFTVFVGIPVQLLFKEVLGFDEVVVFAF
jgi:hypothetical protein